MAYVPLCNTGLNKEIYKGRTVPEESRKEYSDKPVVILIP